MTERLNVHFPQLPHSHQKLLLRSDNFDVHFNFVVISVVSAIITINIKSNIVGFDYIQRMSSSSMRFQRHANFVVTPYSTVPLVGFAQAISCQ